MTNLHHFYHIFADGDWEPRVSDHIRALTQYGLKDSLKSFNVGVVGSVDNFNKVVTYLDQNTAGYELVAHSQEGWEQVTLDPLWERAKEDPSSYFLYCHTKGAANYAEVNERWRKGMTRKLVVEWKNCIEKLDAGCSTVGCHFRPISPLAETPYWGGNFWWATANHINALDRCLSDHRYRAEGWIGTIYFKPEFKPYEIWSADIGAVCADY